jgi:hypothetical protein
MDISLIQQREIEASLAAELIAGFAETIGRDRALKIAGQAIGRMACQAGQDLRKTAGTHTLEDLAGVVREVWARDGALTIDFQNISPDELRFNVTRCRYAELYERMDIGDLGYYLSCDRDAKFARGFNPDIHMTRTQTIMQGAAFCDFHFAFHSKKAANQQGEFKMPRFFRIFIHIFIFAVGIGCVGFTDFWNWEHLRGLVMPILSTGFFFYLVLFMATGEYKVFLPASGGD